jgi:hypothetical protein
VWHRIYSSRPLIETLVFCNYNMILSLISLPDVLVIHVFLQAFHLHSWNVFADASAVVVSAREDSLLARFPLDAEDAGCRFFWI